MAANCRTIISLLSSHNRIFRWLLFHCKEIAPKKPSQKLHSLWKLLNKNETQFRCLNDETHNADVRLRLLLFSLSSMPVTVLWVCESLCSLNHDHIIEQDPHPPHSALQKLKYRLSECTMEMMRINATHYYCYRTFNWSSRWGKMDGGRHTHEKYERGRNMILGVALGGYWRKYPPRERDLRWLCMEEARKTPSYSSYWSIGAIAKSNRISWGRTRRE